MIKNENIICISSIDWDFNWQGHQEIMSEFASSGNRVLFIENTGIRTPSFRDISRLKKRVVDWLKSTKGFRQEAENLYIYSPLILPFPYSKLAQWINKYFLILPLKRWLKVMAFHEPIVWTFLPTRTALNIITSLDIKLLVYYCIADFYELVDNPKKVMRIENELFKKSDLVFAQGKVLEERCRRFNDNVYIFPFGVKIETFNNYNQDNKDTPEDLKSIKRPIVGYLGGIHKHVDFKLIKFVAETNPEWSIVLIGPKQTDTSQIDNLNNVFLLGDRKFSLLPNYLSKFDVCVIPYETSKYTSTVFPTKLNEYHAMGKPVVSTDLPEVSDFNEKYDNLVLIGKTYKEFSEQISQALKGSGGDLVDKRIDCAKRNSWTERIMKMSDLMEEIIEKKAKRSMDWQARFLKFYRLSRVKGLRIAVIALALYLTVFYTPLVWFIASPLKISQTAKRADCIVVFAGGVGESGKAGQGYEERVEYAVQLYKQGFAKDIIFSSGYRYVFKEALIMKALAVSLGIPEQSIILEERAANTYENVQFTSKILTSRGWRNILLVSSPYHMGRVSLVFREIAPEIAVTFTPVPTSRYYAHGNDNNGEKRWKQINLPQIRALCHEYLAIVYYWWKRYI